MRAAFLTPPRNRVAELMDAPTLAEGEHGAALEGLRSINRISGTARSLLPPILELARLLGRRALSAVDIACGGGDVPLALQTLARRRGVELELTLVDKSASALRHAGGQGAAGRMLVADAFSEMVPRADVVMNTLFLHHLDGVDVVRALGHFSSRAEHLLLVSDLRRSWLGLGLAWAGCRVLSRSAIVHHDGPASVRAAWTPAELSEMARAARLERATVRRCWPWRMQLSWRRDR